MAIELKRGCGYRKIGGIYLVSDGGGVPCDRLPIRLEICPCCSGGIKQSRGWTWIDVGLLVNGLHAECHCALDLFCPLCFHSERIGKAGLLWIGEKFYKTPGDFEREGDELGFSRRIHAVPRNFTVGKTWVLLAHPKTVRVAEEVEEGGLFKQIEVRKPGIFRVWLPKRIEKILPESARGSEEVAALAERGVTPVFVPDDDLDHRGSVYDKEAEAIAD